MGVLKLLAYCFHIISGAFWGHTVAEIMVHTIYVTWEIRHEKRTSRHLWEIRHEKCTITSQRHYCEHSLSSRSDCANKCVLTGKQLVTPICNYM